MAFRINKGIFQAWDGKGYVNRFKIDETDGELKEVDDTGAALAPYMKIGDKATDADKLDGLDSGAFLRSNASDDMYGTLTVHSGGANSYGRIRGYGNDNHFIVMRGIVSTNTSTLTITGGHRTTFVEHAEANDNTGWYFVSKQTGKYQEVARITRSGITAPNYNDSNWNTAYNWGNHASAGYLNTSVLSEAQAGLLKTSLGVSGLPYTCDIVLKGDPNLFYPVHFFGGDQNIWRRIIISRNYSWQAPPDWYSSTHKGGLLLDWEGNFGGWGGALYSDRLRTFNEMYSNMVADMYRYTHSMGYVFFLRGGGDTGALYRIFSDQPINGRHQSGTPDIGYDSSFVFYPNNNARYVVTAPEPLTLEQINTRRIDELRTLKRSELNAIYQPVGSYLTTSGKAADSDKVDGYHASALWRSDGAIWNPSANVKLNQSANSQEWSFDITRNGYTGGYWQVWDSANSTMLKVDAVTGKVSAPYGFVGGLTGNASTATTATYLGGYYHADTWIRAKGDSTTVKFYGNSRMMVFRTDGEGGDTGHTGYAFKWTYGGDGTANTLMLLDNNGNVWTKSYGWLHSKFDASGTAQTLVDAAKEELLNGAISTAQTTADNAATAAATATNNANTALERADGTKLAVAELGNSLGTAAYAATGDFLGATAKAADSNLLDGVDSSRFVFGGNATKTTNVSNFTTALSSGFYDAYNTTGTPTGTWYTMINMRHNNTGNNYGSQIAVSFYSNADMFVRTISNGSYQGWSRIWNEANFDPSTKLGVTAKAADADKLDGYDWMQSGKSVRANEFYADNWFRNYNSGEGLYNEATGAHIVSDANERWTIRDAGNTIAIRFATNGNTQRGMVYANSGNDIGFLDAGGSWAIKHTNDYGTRFYSDGATEEFKIGRDAVSGNYGTVQTSSTKGSWGGYSIAGRVVFMHDHSNGWGIYNDVNNEWMVYGSLNGSVQLRYNNATKIETNSGGVTVTGTVTATSFSGNGSGLTNLPVVDQTIPVTINREGNERIVSINMNLDMGQIEFNLANGQTFTAMMGR